MRGHETLFRALPAPIGRSTVRHPRPVDCHNGTRAAGFPAQRGPPISGRGTPRSAWNSRSPYRPATPGPGNERNGSPMAAQQTPPNRPKGGRTVAARPGSVPRWRAEQGILSASTTAVSFVGASCRRTQYPVRDGRATANAKARGHPPSLPLGPTKAGSGCAKPFYRQGATQSSQDSVK